MARLTKIDVAEAHLISAVRLCFDDGPAPSIYLLAASAREILTTIGERLGKRTMLAGISAGEEIPIKDLYRAAHEFTNFFKHADRDPDAVLDNFSHEDAEALLFIACADFGRVTGGKAVDLQVYEAWWFALSFQRVSDAPLSTQAMIRRCRKLFPSGLATATREKRIAMAREALASARARPELAMSIQRAVILHTQTGAAQRRVDGCGVPVT